MKKTIKVVALAMVALMLMLALVSCGAKPNSDPAAAEEALKAAGYSVSKDANGANGPEGCSTILNASKIDGESLEDATMEFVTIYYFKDEASADSAYADIEKDYNKAKDSERYKDMDLDIGKSGKMIYCGTVAAIKAAS